MLQEPKVVDSLRESLFQAESSVKRGQLGAAKTVLCSGPGAARLPNK